jgi:hypothetical protein
MKRYIQTFEVRGKLSFPLDMLRYDACFPLDQESVANLNRALEHGSREEWVVKMCRYAEDKGSLPTFDRWRSFGVSVDPASVMTRKLL